jgi:hypothetical protein
VTPYFTISRLLISTQHYFTSHLGDFNFDEPGDYIVVDYIFNEKKILQGAGSISHKEMEEDCS